MSHLAFVLYWKVRALELYLKVLHCLDAPNFGHLNISDGFILDTV